LRTFPNHPIALAVRALPSPVFEGKLPCGSCEISGTAASISVRINGKGHDHSVTQRNGRTIFHLDEKLLLAENELQLEVHA
jgi:hypothetical protein